MLGEKDWSARAQTKSLRAEAIAAVGVGMAVIITALLLLITNL